MDLYCLKRNIETRKACHLAGITRRYKALLLTVTGLLSNCYQAQSSNINAPITVSHPGLILNVFRHLQLAYMLDQRVDSAHSIGMIE